MVYFLLSLEINKIREVGFVCLVMLFLLLLCWWDSGLILILVDILGMLLG